MKASFPFSALLFFILFGLFAEGQSKQFGRKLDTYVGTYQIFGFWFCRSS